MQRRLIRNFVIISSLVTFVFGAAVAAEPAFETLADHPNAAANDTIVRNDGQRTRELIEAHGYDHVSGLIQDHAGVWRGTAVRYGKTVDVEVDQNGNFYD